MLRYNWDSYVAVSFLFRNDPSKTAKDLGYPYLPQEVTTKEEYEAYVRNLLPLDIDSVVQPKAIEVKPQVKEVVALVNETADTSDTVFEIQDMDCATGACPVR